IRFAVAWSEARDRPQYCLAARPAFDRHHHRCNLQADRQRMTSSFGQNGWRIGIDLGGSKIEGILLSPEATELARYRVATPRNDYEATIAAIVDLAATLMRGLPARAHASIGIAVPGSISPLTGLMQNANSTWLNGRPFDRDL